MSPKFEGWNGKFKLGTSSEEGNGKFGECPGGEGARKPTYTARSVALSGEGTASPIFF